MRNQLHCAIEMFLYQLNRQGQWLRLCWSNLNGAALCIAGTDCFTTWSHILFVTVFKNCDSTYHDCAKHWEQKKNSYCNKITTNSCSKNLSYCTLLKTVIHYITMCNMTQFHMSFQVEDWALWINKSWCTKPEKYLLKEGLWWFEYACRDGIMIISIILKKVGTRL